MGNHESAKSHDKIGMYRAISCRSTSKRTQYSMELIAFHWDDSGRVLSQWSLNKDVCLLDFFLHLVNPAEPHCLLLLALDFPTYDSFSPAGRLEYVPLTICSGAETCRLSSYTLNPLSSLVFEYIFACIYVRADIRARACARDRGRENLARAESRVEHS